MAKKDRLTKKQVMAIPTLLKKKNIGEVARIYKVSWQAIWYHILKLRKHNFKIITRKRGSISKIYN